MPAGRWLYIFILLFPIFLPERTNITGTNKTRGKSAGASSCSSDSVMDFPLVRVEPRISRSSSLPLLHQRRDIQPHRGYQAAVEIPTPIETETSIRCLIP